MSGAHHDSMALFFCSAITGAVPVTGLRRDVPWGDQGYTIDAPNMSPAGSSLGSDERQDNKFPPMPKMVCRPGWKA